MPPDMAPDVAPGHDERPTLGGVEVAADPMVQFDRWLQEAGTDEMVLSTVTGEGHPASRMVLLREHGPDGFVFYTDYRSEKGQQLAANRRVALVFRWLPWRQVRVAGSASKVPRARTERYWASRPRASQLAAWASPQSRPLVSRGRLEAAFDQERRRFEGADVPCPPWWGGYLVVPQTIELWQQGEFRLHDRIRYRRTSDSWDWERLAP